MATGRAIEMRLEEMARNPGPGGAFDPRFAWDVGERRTDAPDSSDVGGCQMATARQNGCHTCEATNSVFSPEEGAPADADQSTQLASPEANEFGHTVAA